MMILTPPQVFQIPKLPLTPLYVTYIIRVTKVGQSFDQPRCLRVFALKQRRYGPHHHHGQKEPFRNSFWVESSAFDITGKGASNGLPLGVQDVRGSRVLL